MIFEFIGLAEYNPSKSQESLMKFLVEYRVKDKESRATFGESHELIGGGGESFESEEISASPVSRFKASRVDKKETQKKGLANSIAPTPYAKI
jgi:hypothetical protein